MYSKPDYTTFTVDGMEILISVYSPSGKVTAKHNARDENDDSTKNLLGKINATKNTVFYCIYQLCRKKCKGFGALEHPTPQLFYQN
jgi:hypothetical protein